MDSLDLNGSKEQTLIEDHAPRSDAEMEVEQLATERGSEKGSSDENVEIGDGSDRQSLTSEGNWSGGASEAGSGDWIEGMLSPCSRETVNELGRDSARAVDRGGEDRSPTVPLTSRDDLSPSAPPAAYADGDITALETELSVLRDLISRGSAGADTLDSAGLPTQTDLPCRQQCAAFDDNLQHAALDGRPQRAALDQSNGASPDDVWGDDQVSSVGTPDRTRPSGFSGFGEQAPKPRSQPGPHVGDRGILGGRGTSGDGGTEDPRRSGRELEERCGSGG